jgi:hypothetical protein
MHWNALLQLPSNLLLVVAAVLLLFALAAVASLRRCRRQRRHVAATWRVLWLLVFLTLAFLSAGLALTLRGWERLADETLVLALDAHHVGGKQWSLHLQYPDGESRDALLQGDAWRVEAVVLKWKLPALLAGVPPLYRLDRLSGRYDDPAEEAEAPRSVVDFNQAGGLDIALLRRQYARWLPMVDTVYGSGVYLPLVDGGHYTVSLMRTGALVARADAATAVRLKQGDDN